MQRFRQDRTLATPSSGEIFIGKVFSQQMVTDQNAPSLRVNSLTFEEGARNRWHRHSTEQVLIIMEGRGIVENESETFQVAAGDIVLIPAGERHWHGAEENASMTHLSILIPGELTIDDEG
ncbi:MAG TPA: cupin domain-containing protein [Thermomicrobiales bacterium]|nr:cupin domain-containing protein [Thermomicrobiales bacterium]